MKLTRPHRHDKIRLIFFSTKDSEIRQFDINLQRLAIWLFLTMGLLCGVFFMSVTIRDSLSQDKTSFYSSNPKDLKNQVEKLEGNIERLNSKLVELEDETEDLEILVGLAALDSSAEVPSNDIEIPLVSLPVDYEYQSDSIGEYLNNLESRIDRALNVQGVIEDKFLRTEREIQSVPSIRPVHGGRITDRFGHRKDPFVERVKHHNGIDLSARYGTKVYAVASGIIEFTRVRYRLNKGYGRVVIVNHQNGYKTLYGHLSKIKVKKGQRVERWDVLGLSGDTGRATGPHLHYEVWRNGRPQNPENYILN